MIDAFEIFLIGLNLHTFYWATAISKTVEITFVIQRASTANKPCPGAIGHVTAGKGVFVWFTLDTLGLRICSTTKRLAILLREEIVFISVAA